MIKTLKGVCPILATAFNDDGSVDYEGTVNIARFMLDAGVHGIAMFGNASEAYTLLDHEKQKISDAVQNEVNGEVPLIYGAGHTGLNGAVVSAQLAQKNGADALMIMPPYMVKPNPPKIHEYYSVIAKSVEIPIMIQDAPIASGVNIPLEILVRLVRENETIQYIKAEAPPTILKIQSILKELGDDVIVFGGLNGMYFYEELCYGAQGCMPAGEFPDAFINIYNAFTSGDKVLAKQRFAQYLPFIRFGTLAGGYAMSIHKEILKRGGIISSSYVRNPNNEADDKLIAQVMDCVRDMGLLALKNVII